MHVVRGMGGQSESGAQRSVVLRAPVLQVLRGCRTVHKGSVRPGGLLSDTADVVTVRALFVAVVESELVILMITYDA